MPYVVGELKTPLLRILLLNLRSYDVLIRFTCCIVGVVVLEVLLRLKNDPSALGDRATACVYTNVSLILRLLFYVYFYIALSKLIYTDFGR